MSEPLPATLAERLPESTQENPQSSLLRRSNARCGRRPGPYAPLHGPRDIRLVKFNHYGWVASSSDSNYISLSMSVMSLENCPTYRAVSYLWGDSEGLENIEISGRQLKIRRNLFDFLDMLSQSDIGIPKGYLWIDQLCINQHDVNERNSQVRMMGDIYASATEVVAWIGRASDNSDEVMRILNRLEDRRVQNSLYANENSSLDSFVAMIRRPYWQRLWIVQELALAQHVKVYCGPESCPGSAFKDALHLNPTTRKLHPGFPLLDTSQYKDLSLAEAIGRHCRAECGDPRDKIFGLASIVRDSERPHVDYLASPAEVFSDVCSQLLTVNAPKLTGRHFDDEYSKKCRQDLFYALEVLQLQVFYHVHRGLSETIRTIHERLKKRSKTEHFTVGLRDLMPWQDTQSLLRRQELNVLERTGLLQTTSS